MFKREREAQFTPETASQPVFHKVAENLYRLESSDAYYALVKKGGKQFRRSLKTKDRKLAERRLNAYSGRYRTPIPIHVGQGSDFIRTAFRFNPDKVPG